jgi:uncharacterized protein (TIGR02466 family)
MKWEIRNWFGSPIFITRLENFQEINKDILEIIKKNVAPSHNEFAHTTDVTLENSYSELKDDLHRHPKFDTLFVEIKKQINFFLEQNHYRMDVFDTYITKAWATFSTKGQRIDRHNHTASHFSLVYYVEAEDQGNVMFDNNIMEGSMYIPPTREYFKDWSEINYPQATYPSRTGNLIIFPSNLFHQTQINHQDKPRISISADILLTIKEGIKAEHGLPSPNTWKKI